MAEAQYKCSQCGTYHTHEEMMRRKFRGEWQPTTWCKCHHHYGAEYDRANPEKLVERKAKYRAKLKRLYTSDHSA